MRTIVKFAAPLLRDIGQFTRRKVLRRQLYACHSFMWLYTTHKGSALQGFILKKYSRKRSSSQSFLVHSLLFAITLIFRIDICAHSMWCVTVTPRHTNLAQRCQKSRDERWKNSKQPLTSDYKHTTARVSDDCENHSHAFMWIYSVTSTAGENRRIVQ